MRDNRCPACMCKRQVDLLLDGCDEQAHGCPDCVELQGRHRIVLQQEALCCMPRCNSVGLLHALVRQLPSSLLQGPTQTLWTCNRLQQQANCLTLAYVMPRG